MTNLLVNIDVEDLEKATRFYCAALGLRVGRRFDGATELLGPDAPTPVHLDFAVTDLPRAVARAKAAGATIEQDIEATAWGRIALLADPFGNGFCLLEFTGRGYDEITQPASG